jgi:hypothetical protein
LLVARYDHLLQNRVDLQWVAGHTTELGAVAERSPDTECLQSRSEINRGLSFADLKAWNPDGADALRLSKLCDQLSTRRSDIQPVHRPRARLELGERDECSDFGGSGVREKHILVLIVLVVPPLSLR